MSQGPRPSSNTVWRRSESNQSSPPSPSPGNFRAVRRRRRREKSRQVQYRTQIPHSHWLCRSPTSNRRLRTKVFSFALSLLLRIDFVASVLHSRPLHRDPASKQPYVSIRSYAVSSRNATKFPPLCRVRVLSDRKSTRLNSSHRCISYAVFCLK